MTYARVSANSIFFRNYNPFLKRLSLSHWARYQPGTRTKITKSCLKKETVKNTLENTAQKKKIYEKPNIFPKVHPNRTLREF